MSTNSDPNDAQNSLLARITAKRKVEENGATTPTVATAIENGNGTGYQYAHKPPSGALRVDTNVEAPVTSKQNKSAYPTFASSSLQALSPGPVTAGPEFGHRLGAAGVGIADSINQVRNILTLRMRLLTSPFSIAHKWSFKPKLSPCLHRLRS